MGAGGAGSAGPGGCTIGSPSTRDTVTGADPWTSDGSSTAQNKAEKTAAWSATLAAAEKTRSRRMRRHLDDGIGRESGAVWTGTPGSA